MYSTGFVGNHPGADPEFWRAACIQGKAMACESWVRQMNISCSHGVGSSCINLGAALDEGRMLAADPATAGKNFARACELGLPNGCGGVLKVVAENQGSSFQSACDRGDGESCFLLGSLSFAGQGVPRDPTRAFTLLQRSCTLGWSRGCSGLAECYRVGVGTTVNNSLAIENYDKACRKDVAASCYSAYSMYRILNDPSKAEARLRHGCQISLGFAETSAAYIGQALPSKLAVPAICASIAR